VAFPAVVADVALGVAKVWERLLDAQAFAAHVFYAYVAWAAVGWQMYRLQIAVRILAKSIFLSSSIV
jgi:hypothetical protein